MKNLLYISLLSFTCFLYAMEPFSILAKPPVNLDLVMATSPEEIYSGFHCIQQNELETAKKAFFPLCSSPDINTRIYAYAGLAHIEEKLNDFGHAAEGYFWAIQQCPTLYSRQKEALSLYLATLIAEKKPRILPIEILNYMRQETINALLDGNTSYEKCNTVLTTFYGI